MRASLKGVLSPDVENLENYIPENPKVFAVLLQLLVGPSGEEGEESFEVVVCTPQWFLKNYHTSEVLIVRHKIIVFEYNYQRIIEAITKYISSCEGKDWPELGGKIGRLGYWEFEDYDPGGKGSE